MEIAELTAVLKVNMTGFMSALQDADKALSGLQRTIADTEAAATSLGGKLATSVTAAGDAITTSNREAAAAAKSFTKAMNDSTAAILSGQAKQAEAAAKAAEAQQAQKTAMAEVAAQAKETAVTVVAAQQDIADAQEKVTLSRKGNLAALDAERQAYSADASAAWELERASYAAANARKSVGVISTGAARGLPVLAGNTESGLFIGAQEAFYGQKQAMQAAAVQAEAYARVLGLVGADSEDAALATQLLGRAVSAAGPYASDTTRQLAGLTTATKAWDDAQGEAAARMEATTATAAALRDELASLQILEKDMGPIVLSVDDQAALAKIETLKAELQRLQTKIASEPPTVLLTNEQRAAAYAAAGDESKNPVPTNSRIFDSASDAEILAAATQKQIIAAQAELASRPAVVASGAQGTALAEIQSRIAAVKSELAALGAQEVATTGEVGGLSAELKAQVQAVRQATQGTQAEANSLVALRVAAAAANSAVSTFAGDNELSAIAADRASAATLRYQSALRYTSLAAQEFIGEQEMLNRAVASSQAAFGTQVATLQNAERDFMAAMQNASASGPGTSENLLYRLQAANALATIEQTYGRAVQVNDEVLDKTYATQNAIVETMNVQIAKADEVAMAQAKTASAIEKQQVLLNDQLESATAIVNTIKDQSNLTAAQTAALVQQARVEQEILAYQVEVEAAKARILGVTEQQVAAEEELTIAQQASLVAAARAATVTDLQGPVTTTRAQVAALQESGIAANDPALLTLKKQLADQEAALLTQQRRVGLAPPEEKLPPPIRIKQIESPFKAGAAEEIDSVAKSTRGAAGSFFNLGTAAAFASTSFLVGLFGGTALRAVVEASRNLSTAQTVLGNTVRNVGGDWKAQQDAIASYIEKAADASGFTDTDLTNSLTRLVAATGSVKAGESALTIATDLARSKNLDLATSVKDVTLVTEGHASILRRQGIVLPIVTSATQALKERLAQASDAGIHFTAASKLAAAQLAKQHDTAATAALDMVVLRSSVTGADAAFAKSSRGGIEQFKVATERIEVAIGNALIPTFDKLVRGLANTATAWVKSGNVTKDATEGINLVKSAVETVVPVVENLFSALKDAVNSLGGLKSVMVDLAAIWVAKFAILEHPVLTLAIALDQLLQHFQALHGVIGPLLAVAGGVFLAIKIGAADAITKFAVFFGLVGKGTTEFKSLTEIIVGGMTAAQTAIAGTIAELRGLTAAEAQAASAAKGLDVSELAAGPAGAARSGLAVGAAEGGVAAEGGALAGLAAVPFGPITLGLLGIGGAMLYAWTKAGPLESATKGLTKSLLGLQSATQQLDSAKLSISQDKISISMARQSLAATSAYHSSNAYKEAVLTLKSAINQLAADQQRLKDALNGTASAYKQATAEALKLKDAAVGNNPDQPFHGRGPGLKGADLAASQAKAAAGSTADFTEAIQKNIVANKQFSPTIQRNGLLLNQFVEILGDPKLLTPHEVKVILQNQDAKAQLMDLIHLLGTLPKEVIVKIREEYLVSTTGAPPSAVTGHASGSLQQAYTGITQVDRNAIQAATTALTIKDSKQNTDRLIAANEKALKDVRAINATASTVAQKNQDIALLVTAIKDLKSPPGDLTVKPPSSNTKLTGLAALIGAHGANALTQAQTAAASAGAPEAGIYSKKILDAQDHLRVVLNATLGLLHNKLNQVGSDTKTGVKIQSEIRTLTSQVAASTKKIAEETGAREAAAVHKRVDAILGISKTDGPVSVQRARAEEHSTLLDILKKEGGKAGLSAFGPGVASQSNKQLEALIRENGAPKSTLNSLQKIDQSINITASKGQKLTQEENANIQERLKEIKNTLAQNKYQSNYVTPSAHTLTAGLGLSRAQRVAEEARISQFQGHNGSVPTALAGAGIPFPGSGAYGPNDNSPGVAIPPRQPAKSGNNHPPEIKIENVYINEKQVWSVKKLTSELLSVSNRNSTQTKGANAGKGPT